MTDNSLPTLDEVLDKFLATVHPIIGNGQVEWPVKAEDAAKAALAKIMAAAQLEKLKELSKHKRTYRRTITDPHGGVYVDDSEVFISEYEWREMVAELEARVRGEEVIADFGLDGIDAEELLDKLEPKEGDDE